MKIAKKSFRRGIRLFVEITNEFDPVSFICQIQGVIRPPIIIFGKPVIVVIPNTVDG